MQKISINSNNYFAIIFVILAISSLFMSSTLYIYESKISSSTLLVNMAGKQRMLSQKLLTQSYQYFGKHIQKKAILDTQRIFEHNHSTHIKNLSSQLDKDLYFQSYHTITKDLNQYIDSVNLFLKNPNEKTLNTIALLNPPLITKLDNAVSTIEQVHSQLIRQMIQWLFFIGITTVSLILLSFFYIIKPIQKQLVEEKKKAEKALYFKELFLANMSHEIRTPLNAILGYIQIVKEAPDVPAQIQDDIQIIGSSSEMLLNIINDILDISKIESGQQTLSKSFFNPVTEFSLLFNLLKMNAEAKSLLFTLTIDEKLHDIEILADLQKLKQVLSNLLGNAIKFTPLKKKVDLKIELCEQTEDKVILKFLIIDEGIGISLENQQKIFEKFSQEDENTSHQYGGTGLGLSISKEFVHLHGSTINIQSEKDQGATFSFELESPYKKTEPKTVQAPTQTPVLEKFSKIKKDSLKILVAEDVLINRMLLERYFEEQEIDSIFAHNGEEAISLFKEHYHDLDLVFLDINMPVLDGIGALKAIQEFAQEHQCTQKIIALTANSVAGDKEKFLDLGFDDYLSKPIQKNLLYESIDMYTQKGTHENTL